MMTFAGASADGRVDATPRVVSRWVDIALAAPLTAGSQIAAWSGTFRGPVGVNALLALAMTVPLFWRRSRPLPVLSVVVAVVGIQALVFGATETAAVLLPLLAAVYSAAAYGGPAYVVASIALLGIVVHDLRDPLVDSPSQAWFSPLVTTAVFAVGRVVHSRRCQAEEAVARAAAAERDREQAIADAVESEQRRLGREVHDVVAHSISVMALHAGAAEQVLDRSPERAREALRLIQRTGHDAAREMGRLLSHEGGESREPLPSMSAVPELLGRVRAAGLDVDMIVEGARRDMTPALDLSLFRIVQEGLTNALKHAPSARTTVRVRYDKDAVSVEVLSEGPTARHENGSAGRGLRGIAERVDAVGGRLEAGPYSPSGWRLAAVVPAP
jgi:signal transduction histidine kinase